MGILSVLVFGAGTDYALLLISRYRDELRIHEDRYVAMRRARRRTAEAVLSSASTVVVGVLTPAALRFPPRAGLGVASAVGIVVAAAAPCWCCRRPWCSSVDGCSGPWSPGSASGRWPSRRSLWRRVGRVVARPRVG